MLDVFEVEEYTIEDDAGHFEFEPSIVPPDPLSSSIVDSKTLVSTDRNFGFINSEQSQESPEEIYIRKALADLRAKRAAIEQKYDFNQDGVVTPEDFDGAGAERAFLYRGELIRYHREHLKPVLSEIGKFRIDVDLMKTLIEDMAADKDLDLTEALIFERIPKDIADLEILRHWLDEKIQAGDFDDVQCRTTFKHQRLDNCVVVAQKMVLDEYGINLSEAGLTLRAMVDGTLTATSGVHPLRATDAEILERYGLEPETMAGATIEMLENLRAEGRPPIVAIDAGEAWATNYDDNEDAEDAGKGVNHVVVFLRVDRSDPDNPMVVVNDSGRHDGGELRIPLVQFQDAWADSGNYVIVPTEPVPPHPCDVRFSQLDQATREAMLQD